MSAFGSLAAGGWGRQEAGSACDCCCEGIIAPRAFLASLRAVCYFLCVCVCVCGPSRDAAAGSACRLRVRVGVRESSHNKQKVVCKPFVITLLKIDSPQRLLLSLVYTFLNASLQGKMCVVEGFTLKTKLAISGRACSYVLHLFGKSIWVKLSGNPFCKLRINPNFI
jgi:hypothetical protein